jgi:predicted ATPase/DNA-binding CsgD family transcriptional regulator
LILGSVKPTGELPGQLTSFIGRRSSVEMVSKRLMEDRLVTLVGPGGCGKTRIAIEVGRRFLHSNPEPVYFVDLSALSSPELAAGAVRSALGLPEVRGQPALTTLVDRLAGRELLLLLDNCEHLVEACAALADAVLSNCPGVRLLATSRERLGVGGEVVVAVGGLELPSRPGAGPSGWTERSEAESLFIERASAVDPDFSLSFDEALVVARICERLDGIPLAVELAAARAAMMSVGAIEAGLSDRFRLLAGPGRTGPPRHRTLLASIEWSCNLLTEAERAVLYRLSVFASGFTLAAAEAVCAGDDIEGGEVLALLTSLVEKSLVQAMPRQDRFGLHETMRAYGAAALEGEAPQVRDRHLSYFTELAQATGSQYWTSEATGSSQSLEAELGNVRAALDWAVASGQFDAGAELMSGAGELFYGRGLQAEGVTRCQELLVGELSPRGRAQVLAWGAQCSVNLDPATSLCFAEELTALGRSLGDDALLARGLISAANVYSLGETHRTVAAVDEALPLARSLGQHDLVVWGLMHKSNAYKWLCRAGEAVALAEESVRVAEEAGWVRGAMLARANLAWAAHWAGQLERAVEEAETVLRFAKRRSEPLFRVRTEAVVGDVLCRRGDSAGLELLERAISVALKIGDLFEAASIEQAKGARLMALGQLDDGYAVMEAAIAKLEALGVTQGHVDAVAALAEGALRRGDMGSARRHLAVCARRAPTNDEPWAAPRLRAEARLARAQGEPHRAYLLAGDGFALAAGSGALLYAIDLLDLLAVIAADLERPVEAARLLGAADSQRELTGYVRLAPASDELAPVLGDVQAAMSPAAFEQAMAEGRALTLEDTVAFTRRGRGEHRRARSGWDSLTPSEHRVASLVGQALTNDEIAKRLFISIPTVKSHLTHMYAKLGLANRGQLAAAWHRRDEA